MIFMKLTTRLVNALTDLLYKKQLPDKSDIYEFMLKEDISFDDIIPIMNTFQLKNQKSFNFKPKDMFSFIRYSQRLSKQNRPLDEVFKLLPKQLVTSYLSNYSCRLPKELIMEYAIQGISNSSNQTYVISLYHLHNMTSDEFKLLTYKAQETNTKLVFKVVTKQEMGMVILSYIDYSLLENQTLDINITDIFGTLAKQIGFLPIREDDTRLDLYYYRIQLSHFWLVSEFSELEYKSIQYQDFIPNVFKFVIRYTPELLFDLVFNVGKYHRKTNDNPVLTEHLMEMLELSNPSENYDRFQKRHISERICAIYYLIATLRLLPLSDRKLVKEFITQQTDSLAPIYLYLWDKEL